jgi:hypothetical protein
MNSIEKQGFVTGNFADEGSFLPRSFHRSVSKEAMRGSLY